MFCFVNIMVIPTLLCLLLAVASISAQTVPYLPTCALSCPPLASAAVKCSACVIFLDFISVPSPASGHSTDQNCQCNNPSFVSLTLSCASKICAIEDYSSAIGAMGVYCSAGTSTGFTQPSPPSHHFPATLTSPSSSISTSSLSAFAPCPPPLSS